MLVRTPANPSPLYAATNGDDSCAAAGASSSHSTPVAGRTRAAGSRTSLPPCQENIPGPVVDNETPRASAPRWATRNEKSHTPIGTAATSSAQHRPSALGLLTLPSQPPTTDHRLCKTCTRLLADTHVPAACSVRARRRVRIIHPSSTLPRNVPAPHPAKRTWKISWSTSAFPPPVVTNSTLRPALRTGSVKVIRPGGGLGESVMNATAASLTSSYEWKQKGTTRVGHRKKAKKKRATKHPADCQALYDQRAATSSHPPTLPP